MDEFQNRLIHGDCLEVMKSMPPQCVDAVLGSPPYEKCRTYGIDFSLSGQEWVDWMVDRVVESLRVCRGLVAFAVEGQTRKFRWTATPALLMADLHRRGVHLRKPPAFCRVGIPGSGGPDWVRNDYEFIVCATNGGKLPWSDNTAMGHPPKWAPGGDMSHRLSSGARVNQWGHPIESGATVVDEDGSVRSEGRRPLHVEQKCGVGGKMPETRDGDCVRKIQTRRKANGDRVRDGMYEQPAIANPGNLIHCKVGGGLMGSRISHENEAPFPEALAEFFIRSFCVPGGTVLDPFAGSGTTLAVAERHGRKWIGIDIRESQIELCRRRIEEVRGPLFSAENNS